MRKMEEILRGSDLDWTIMRPSGLFDAPGVTDYELNDERARHLHQQNRSGCQPPPAGYRPPIRAQGRRRNDHARDAHAISDPAPRSLRPRLTVSGIGTPDWVATAR